jgi:hypothetical protein
MQKARRHFISKLRPLVSVWFQVLLSPSCSEYFSPFLHSTGSLSVSQMYLALPDGAGNFKRGVSDPALLRIPPLHADFLYGAITLYGPVSHPVHVVFASIMWSYNPPLALTNEVWALALSLATTGAITIVFSSSRYLDVSVPWVCSSCEVSTLQVDGLPHSDTCGSIPVCGSPQLFAAYHVLRRL